MYFKFIVVKLARELLKTARQKLKNLLIFHFSYNQDRCWKADARTGRDIYLNIKASYGR